MIRIRQCRDDCCAVKVFAERRWYVHLPTVRASSDTFTGAVHIATTSPLETP